MAIQYDVYASAIVIDSTNNVIRIAENGGVSAGDVTLTAGTYYLYGGGTESGDFCEHLQARLIADSPTAQSYAVTFAAKITAGGVTGTLSINPDTVDVQILGTHANMTADLTVLGFANGADTAQADPLESTLSPRLTWCSTQPPVLVDGDGVRGSSIRHESSGGKAHTFVVDDPVEYRRARVEFEHADRCHRLDSSSDEARTFQSWWEDARKGRPIRLYRATQSGGSIATLTSSALIDTFTLSRPLDAWLPSRDSGIPTWGWEIELREHF